MPRTSKQEPKVIMHVGYVADPAAADRILAMLVEGLHRMVASHRAKSDYR